MFSLLVSVCGAGIDLLFGAASKWMLQQRKRVVGQTQHACDVFCGDLEGRCTQYDRGFAELLVDNAVVQTARRTRTSVAVGGDQYVAVCRQACDYTVFCWCAGVAFEYHIGKHFALIMQTEKLSSFQ